MSWENLQKAKELAAEMDQAEDEFNRAQKLISEIAREVPSGLPFPDSEVRIAQAGWRAKIAYGRYRRALRRYQDFLDDKLLPDASKPVE